MQAAIAAVSSIRVGEGTPKERKGKQSWEQTARPEVKRALKESMTQLGSVPSEAAAVIGTEGQAGGASEELSYPPGFGPTPQFVVATIPVVGVTPLEENAMAAEDQVEGKDRLGRGRVLETRQQGSRRTLQPRDRGMVSLLWQRKEKTR